jgi:hypothetical protein
MDKHVPAEGQFQSKGPKPIPFTGFRVLPHPKIVEIYLRFLSWCRVTLFSDGYPDLWLGDFCRLLSLCTLPRA